MQFRNFQKIIASVGLLTMVLLIAGCPYASSVPVDEGTVKIDDKLVGKWISTTDTATENPTYFDITRDDKYHATARKMEFSSTDSTYSETVYHLTFSNVNGETFMNAIEADGNTYNIFKFSYDPITGLATNTEVSDYIKERFNNSKELKDFIAKNKSNSYFYTNTSDTYVRR